MSKAKPLLFGAALGASAMFFAQQYHVVHSHDGLQVIPRTPQQSLGLAYADIRNWSASQWTDRPELARALMAHGSTDLISESVATSLADRVSEDTSTLDELRGFLNGAKKASSSLLDGTPGFPSSGAAESSDPGHDGSDNDLFRIPFPQDARTKVPADPFREARAEDKSVAARTDAGSSLNQTAESIRPQKSRFSSEEVLESLNAAEFEEQRSTGAGSAEKTTPQASAKPEKSVIEQANEMAERIFGKSTSTGSPSGSVSPPFSSKPATPPTTAKATPKLTESESMFEEVTTQLENRAQEALNRAKDSARDKAASAVQQSSAASANYVRDRTREALPDAANAILKSEPANPKSPAPSPVLDFDPFLE